MWSLRISVTTFDRWRSGVISDSRKAAVKVFSRKLTLQEEKLIVDTCCNTEYKDLNPHKIHALLLDEGCYIASISSFYRVLRNK